MEAVSEKKKPVKYMRAALPYSTARVISPGSGGPANRL